MPAPFKPVIRDELDVSNFAEEFTEMDPTYSPAALPQNCDRIFQVGGCSEMLNKHPFVMTHTFVVHRQGLCFVVLAGHCTGQHLYLLLLCADVCLGFGCRQCDMLTQMKNRIIHYLFFVCDYI